MQADLILELENDVSKAMKQEKVYEDAIEQLQAEQDALEAENAKLRKGQGSSDRQGKQPPSAYGESSGLMYAAYPAASSGLLAMAPTGIDGTHAAEQVSRHAIL